MRHCTRQLIASVILWACMPAIASDRIGLPGSVWFYDGTESPSMCIKFLPNGTFLFEGGYLYFNPSRWSRSTEDPDLVHIRLGGKVRFPTPIFKDYLSRNWTSLVSVDGQKRLLTYRIEVGQDAIDFMGFIFYRQAQCAMPNPSLNQTHNGMPPTGLISFWPFGALPSRAG